MEAGIRSVLPAAEVKKVPIADGGEGTVEALVLATGGRLIAQEVAGPLGDPVTAYWGLLGDGETAVIEMAAASGLTLVPKKKRDPRITSTYGTGQLVKAALATGVRTLIIGIGGSATNDGGTGMMRALGAKFLDAAGRELPDGGAALAHLASMDLSGMDSRLAQTRILVACDVNNPLCGPRGATAVYGPQKGASAEMVVELDRALANFAAVAKATTGKDVAECPGAGAAGGLGAGLLFFTAAALRPGVEIVLEATGFASIVRKADLVITGEGNTDFQTAHGKAPVGVAKVAKQFGVPTVCLSGGLGKGYDAVLTQGIDGIMSIVPQPMTLDECMGTATGLIETAAARLCLLLKAGAAVGKRMPGDFS
jgi:glycerate kinase